MLKILPFAFGTSAAGRIANRTPSRLAALLLLLLPGLTEAQTQTPAALAPIRLGTTAYTQDFNTLAQTGTSSVVPAGFGFVETNAGTSTDANSTYTAVTVTASGGPNSGDTYSYGFGTSAPTDRAFGSLRSGSLVPQFGFAFTNNSEAAITSLTVSYTGETYRLASVSAARADRLDFQYSTDATSLTTGTFTDVDALDYAVQNTNATANGIGTDGNDPANRAVVSGTITGLSIAAGATFYVRFNDANASGADDGLAIDDFSLTAGFAPACNAAFAYAGSPFCQSGTNPTATVTGTSGGTFSSATGLSINAATGAINLAASTPGTYTVTYTVSASCSSTQSVTITAPASATFGYASTSNFCTSNTSAVTPALATGATAGTFSSTTGLTLDAATGAITPSTSTPGTYTVTNTVAAAGGCPASTATASVAVNGTPIATLTAGGPTTFCQGGSVVLTAPAGTGNTYQFFNGTTSLGAASASNTFTASTGGSYTVVVSNAGGCSATSTATTVTVNPQTTATFSFSSSAFCQSGTNPTPTITGTSGGTFSAPAGLSIDPSTGTINLTASTQGTYVVTYSVSGPCPSTATQSITVSASAVATFSYASGAYCVGGANPTPALAPGATAGTFSSTTGLAVTATTGVIDLTASTPGTYTVTNTVAASGGCAGTSATTQVVINAATTATFSYAGSPFCQSGTNPTATVTGTSGGTFSSATGLSINATTGAINLTASTPGTYTVTYSVSGPCPSSSTRSVTITAPANATFSYASTTYCVSGTANPVVTLGAGATAGTFASTTGLTVDAATGAITLGTSTPGTYTITNTVAASGGCAAVTATAAVTITAAPTAAFGYGTAPSFCTTATGAVSAGLGTGSTAGTFSAATGLSLDAATGAITPSTSTPGTYTVTNTVAAAGGCAATTATATVTITAPPTAGFSYANATNCVSGTANPTAALATGATAGTFSSTTGLTINAATGAITLGSSTPGTYTVTNTVAAAGGCAAVTATSTVTITAAPTATFSYASAVNCEGAGTVTATLATGTTAGTFSSTAGLTINATTGAVDLATSTPGTYTVTNAVAAAGGCAAATATAAFAVTARPARPVLTAAYNGTTTTLSSSAATGNQFYLSGVAIAGATDQTYVVTGTPAQLGSYTVGTTSSQGCASLPSAALVVTSSARPRAGSALRLYPNPTPDGRFNVELAGYTKAVELTVYNALGQVVYSATLKATAGTTVQPIDLTPLPSGVYVLRAKTEGGLDTRRIVKQ